MPANARRTIIFTLAVCCPLLYAAGSDIWGLDGRERIPFNTEVLSSSTDDGTRVEEVYFTSEIAGGEPVRVYGFIARPEPVEGRIPAILELHGGGGTANKASATGFARDLGMCVLNIDWSGRPERGTHVSTAAGLPTDLFGDPRGVTEDLSDFSARHTIRALVRCIDFLEAQPYVDPDRIGVMGGSWGGFLTLLTAGLDPRVKCAVSGFGAGGFRGTHEFCARPILALSEAQREFWFDTVDPIHYLDRIGGPVALLTATNELHFWLNTAKATYGKLPAGSRIMIAPNAVHVCRAGVIWPNAEWARLHFGDAPDWPEIKDFTFDGAQATWSVDGGVPIEKSTLYFSPGREHWPSRVWLPAATTIDGNTHKAVLPVWASGAEADAYPLVIDERHRSVSVPPVHADGLALAGMSAARPKPGRVDGFTEGVGAWRLLFDNARKGTLEWRKPGQDRPGAMVVRETRSEVSEIEVETNLIYLAVAQLSSEAVLRFMVDTAGFATPLGIQIVEDPGEEHERGFGTRTALIAKRGWQEVKVPLTEFTGAPDWTKVRKLSLKLNFPPGGSVAFANIRVEPQR